MNSLYVRNVAFVNATKWYKKVTEVYLCRFMKNEFLSGECGLEVYILRQRSIESTSN